MSAPMTEADIIKALEKRHQKDIFVSHCKTGPSWLSNPLIFDAWAMPRSWVKPIIGYEIKTSVQDYARDRKWRGYLHYCHKFYFVCPAGLLTKQQVFYEEAGLIYVYPDSLCVRVQKHAPFLRCNIPSEIYEYILMWRACGIKERGNDNGYTDDR